MTVPLDHGATTDSADLDRTLELLIEARRAPEERARELEAECVRLNMPLARSLASRYARHGVSAEDLNQVAYLGLLKAIRRFDPGRGDPFLAFAAPTIRGELRRYFRDCGWVVRPPRRIQELQARAWAVEHDLVQRSARPPTVTELADTLGADTSAVLEALSIGTCFSPRSLDAPLGQFDGDSLAERLGATDQGYERTDALLTVARAMSVLGERDRRIISLRFVHGLTQKQIGDAIGVTQMQVSRLLARILCDLRVAIGDYSAA